MELYEPYETFEYQGESSSPVTTIKIHSTEFMTQIAFTVASERYLNDVKRIITRIARPYTTEDDIILTFTNFPMEEDSDKVAATCSRIFSKLIIKRLIDPTYALSVAQKFSVYGVPLDISEQVATLCTTPAKNVKKKPSLVYSFRAIGNPYLELCHMAHASEHDDPLNHLNETQKHILRVFIGDILDEAVRTLGPEHTIPILRSLTEEGFSSERRAQLREQRAWEPLQTLHRIFIHPCPQNRCAVNSRREVIYTSDNGEWLSEEAGLLGLTARDDDTALPITKEAVVEYILLIVARKISELERPEKSTQAPTEAACESNPVIGAWTRLATSTTEEHGTCLHT